MIDPYDIAAQRLLPVKIDAIRRFWEHFVAHAEELDGIFATKQGELDRVASIMSPLKEIDPDVMWEFGPSEKGHAICITAEWRNALRATARAVVNMAPDMERFAVTDARTGNTSELLEENFTARFQMPITVSSIACKRGSDNKVEMTGTGPGSEEQTGNEILGLATYLLGETMDRAWFGDVNTAKLKSGLLGFARKSAPTFDPEAFKAAFASAVEDIRADLPVARRAEADLEGEQRTLIQCNELVPQTGRSDLIMFNTASESYAQAAITTTRFSSVNHSRHHEWFAFLRVPRGPETPFDDVDDRYVLEDRVHSALSGAGLGGFIAGGHGREAVYVDMALDQIDGGLGVLAGALNETPGFADMSVHFLEAGLAEAGFPLSSFQSATN